MRISTILCILLFASSTFAQDVTQIVQTGNAYYESQDYIKAIKFYKEAIKQEEGNHTFAMFQLGECYRKILDYTTAEYYYEEVKKAQDSRYPLAGFYLGLMKKLSSKYDEALPLFEEFIDYIYDLSLSNDKYRTYYEQAKNEREGCLLALNELTTTRPSHNTAALPSPVNTQYNDYAAFFYGDDNAISVTSAKKDSEGIGNTFGEAFSDIYRYFKVADSWSQAKLKDDLEKIVNTKYGDGTGTFNKAKDKLYYTYCDESGNCSIFLTRKKAGKWQAPVKLKGSINPKGSSSKHPSLSPAGDTLYFSSNRKGGFGGMDIWMSISSNGENWSQPINLGDQVNTPFDEISPFYSEYENAMFFSSNGHRGFGGYDNYMAKGDTYSKAEVFNLGVPFNSNKDDCFFIIGESTGYLSSNRDGGAGKFDIYAFDINSKKEIIAEIGKDEAIAGRKSMFSDDLEFETDDIKKINEIISRLLASKLEGVDLVLSNTQLDFYDALSLDDKEKIERIVNSRFRKISESELQDLHVRDEYYYVSLSDEEKSHVDRMVMAYVEEEDLASSIHLNKGDIEFYELLSERDKEKIDQIIASRVKTARDFKFESSAYDEFEEKEQINIDQITYQYLKEKKNIDQLTLNMTNNAFVNQLSEDKKELLQQSIKEKMLNMSGEDKNLKITVEDRVYYQSLSDSDLEKIKHIAHSFLLSDVNSISEFVSKEDMEFYNKQSIKHKGHIDKVIAKMIKNTALSDLLYAESNFEKDQIGLLQQSVTGAASLNQMLEAANRTGSLKNMDPNDQNRMMRFLSSGAPSWMNREDNVFFEDEETVTADYNEMVARRDVETIETGPIATVKQADPNKANAYTNGLEIRRAGSNEREVVKLSDAALKFYKTLTVENQLKIDRFIAARYINEDYKDGSLIQSDLEFEKSLKGEKKTYVKMLSKKLGGGFLTVPEESMLNEAFIFYGTVARTQKPQWNRAVIVEALDINSKGNYLAQKKDYSFYKGLEAEKKELVAEIEVFRFKNHRILSENMGADSKDVILPGLTRNIPKYEVETDLMSIEGTLIDNNSGTSVSSFPVALENDEGRKVYQTNTNEKGEFSFESIATDDYKLVSGSDEYAKEFQDSYFIKDLNIKELEESTFEEQTATSIYYEINSFQLRNEARATLDELLVEYRKGAFNIELEAHTDNSGSRALNERLSKNRGEFAANYLKQGGVQDTDIIIRYYGSNKPKASNDNVYGRQFNRRIDINMRSKRPLNYTPKLVYLARPKATVLKLSELYGISEVEIKKDNGLQSGQLAALQPVRLPDNKNVKPDLNLLVPMNTNVTKYSSYVVKKGETVITIAEKLRIPEELIMELNDLDSVNVPEGKTIVVIYIQKQG